MSEYFNFLPFFFLRLGKRVLLTNDIGNYIFLNENEFKQFITKQIPPNTELYYNLISKNFIFQKNLPPVIKMLSAALRTKRKTLFDFTSLHMLIVTQRCNQRCLYCHASCDSEESGDNFDMNLDTTTKCIDMALLSPSKSIKFEFQGGEPLLNFNAIKHAVLYAKDKTRGSDKNLQFVICTNLTLLNGDHIDFIRDHNVYLSTSLDGPQSLHNQYRKFRSGAGTHSVVIEKLHTIKQFFGNDKVSALLTITKPSLNHLDKVIDEYIEAGLPSIFLRMLNPHGLAIREWETLGYSVDDFISAYRKALDYIIKINMEGKFFPEEFFTILLKRILTPFPNGFVDLQSPSGAGISAVAYEINGDVYVADEGRMLAKGSGDKTFCIGNVHSDSFDKIFCSKKLLDIAQQSTIECVPGCAWCVFQPFCGSDPIRNYMQFQTFGSTNSRTTFCDKHKAIFKFLFKYLDEAEDSVIDIFWSWVNN